MTLWNGHLKWLNYGGITFIPEALSWEPGPRNEVSWWDEGSFHQNLRDSDGLKPQKSTSISFDEAPERVKAAYEIVIPHYEHLRHYKID